MTGASEGKKGFLQAHDRSRGPTAERERERDRGKREGERQRDRGRGTDSHIE